MIVGLLSDVSNHKTVLPGAVVRAIEAVQKLDLAGMATGRYELEGDQLFYLVQDAEPRALADCQAEAHRQYADVQMPVGASERFGFSLPQADLLATEQNFETRDIAFYPTPANEFFMDVAPGAYVVFWPGELHRPCVVIADKTPFRKVVIKIHKSLLGL